jgi:PPM family protein phosphatase
MVNPPLKKRSSKRLADPTRLTKNERAKSGEARESQGFKVRSRGATDPGLARLVNEDSFRVIKNGKWKMFLVADGIGGPTKGGVAAEIVLETIGQVVQEEASLSLSLIRKAVERANEKVLTKSSQSPLLKGMASTICGIAIEDKVAYVINVGNSRAYRCRKGKLVGLTVDHTLAGELRALGSYDESVEKTRRASQLLTRSVGGAATIEVDVTEDKVEEGDIYLVCSDGITTHISDNELQRSLSKSWSKGLAQELVDQANDKGGSDNITALVISVEDPHSDAESGALKAKVGGDVQSSLDAMSTKSTSAISSMVPSGSDTVKMNPSSSQGAKPRARASFGAGGTSPSQSSTGAGVKEPPADEAARIERLIREAFGLPPTSASSPRKTSLGVTSKVEVEDKVVQSSASGVEGSEAPSARASFEPSRSPRDEAKGSEPETSPTTEAESGSRRKLFPRGTSQGREVAPDEDDIDQEARKDAAQFEKAADQRVQGSSIPGVIPDETGKGKEATSHDSSAEKGTQETSTQRKSIPDGEEDEEPLSEEDSFDEEEDFYDDEVEYPPPPPLSYRFMAWLFVGFFVGALVAFFYPRIGAKNAQVSRNDVSGKTIKETRERGESPSDLLTSQRPDLRKRVEALLALSRSPEGNVLSPQEKEALEILASLEALEREGAEREAAAVGGSVKRDPKASSPQPSSPDSSVPEVALAYESQAPLLSRDSIIQLPPSPLRRMILDVVRAIQGTMGKTSERLNRVVERQEEVAEKLNKLSQILEEAVKKDVIFAPPSVDAPEPTVHKMDKARDKEPKDVEKEEHPLDSKAQLPEVPPLPSTLSDEEKKAGRETEP